MLTTLRKFTVVFLAIVQLIAPLVHAHVGEKTGLLPNSGLGALHVPGLERYSVGHDASVSPQQSLYCNVVAQDFSADGMLIGINTGIKDRPANLLANPDHSHYLHQQSANLKTVASLLAIAPPTPAQQFVAQLLIPSLSPRAPPIQ